MTKYIATDAELNELPEVLNIHDEDWQDATLDELAWNVSNFFSAVSAHAAPDQSFANARGKSATPRSGKWLLED